MNSATRADRDRAGASDTAPPPTLQGKDIRPLFQNPTSSIQDAVFSEIGDGGPVSRDLEVEYLGFRRHIDQVRPAIQKHVCKKVCLVNLTSLGAWDSNSN